MNDRCAAPPALVGLVNIFILCLGLAYLAWWLVSVTKPIRNDDALWTYSAMAILEKGIPMIEYGPGPSRHLALWHPPLFQYWNAAIFKIFGWSEFAARLCGLLGLVGAWFAGRLALAAAGIRNRDGIFALALLLPVALFQTSLIPDIDGSLLLPAAVGLAAAQARGLLTPEHFPRWTAAGFLALMLLSKWTTPPFIVLAWALYLAVALGPITAIRQVGFTSVVGGFMAAAVFLLWSAAMGVSPFYPVEFSFLSKAGSISPSWVQRIESLKNGLSILGPGLLMVIAALLLRKTGDRANVARLFAFQFLVIGAAYSLLYPGLYWHVLTWKYLAPALGLLALAVAFAWPDRDQHDTGDHWRGLFLAVIVAGTAAVFMRHSNYSPISWALKSCLVGLFASVAIRITGASWRRAVLVSGLCLAMVTSVRYSVLMTHRNRDNSPSFPTSEKGFSKMVLWLQANAGADDVILARKDLTVYLPPKQGVPIDPHFFAPVRGARVSLTQRPPAYAFQNIWPFKVDDSNFYTSFELVFVNEKEKFADWLLNRVNVVVDSRMDSYLKEDSARALVEKHYYKVAEMDDYTAYRRNGT